MGLTLSYSRMKSMLECEGIYYWKYVRELEKIQWKTEFLMGDMHHLAVYRMMVKDKNYEKTVLKAFDDRVKDLRKTFSISIEDEQGLIQNRHELIGMMRGYASKYEKDLKIEKHIMNESDNVYLIPKFSGGKIRIKIDNIVEVNKKWYLHEMKAWKSLKPDIINNTKNNFQTAVYFWIHNYQYKLNKKHPGKPFSGIIFDALQKPSIRKTKGENYKQYLKRLEEYYDGPESKNKFYKEIFDEPGIPEEKVVNTIIGCHNRMDELHKGRDPLLSFNKCAWCDFLGPCIEGEKKHIMVNYRRKKDVSANETNKR